MNEKWQKNLSSSSESDTLLGQFDGGDDNDDPSPLSKWVKNRNASSVTQPVQEENEKSATQTDDSHSTRKPNTKVSYEIMPGYRCDSKVLFCPDEQQFYLRNCASDCGIGYTCYVKACKCRVHIRNNECYIGNAIAHNHERKTEMLYNLRALNEIKRILRSRDNQLSPEEVFDEVIKRHPQCKLVFKDHERGLLELQIKYALSNGVAAKKRARSNHLSGSNGGRVAKKKKTKRSSIPSTTDDDDSMNAAFPDQDLQNTGSVQTMTTQSKRNDDMPVASPRHSLPSCERCKCKFTNANSSITKSSALESQISDEFPQTPLLSTSDDDMSQVYVREADLNRLIQSGHIFIKQGRFHYK